MFKFHKDNIHVCVVKNSKFNFSKNEMPVVICIPRVDRVWVSKQRTVSLLVLIQYITSATAIHLPTTIPNASHLIGQS